MRCFHYLIEILVLLLVELNAEEKVFVNSPLGGIRGAVLKTRNGHDILAFRGIRYAEAPIGERRFRAPIPVKAWQGVLDATNDGPICPQSDPGVISEDCLNLNVYTRNLSAYQPVMVYLHGGGFFFGSGLVASPDYLLDKEIILVTINYRLGALGFLSTGSAEAPGNYGFKDQVTALKWVRDNIKAFGGNPNLVTLVGHSAGSMSVNLHLVSSMSKGLFQRAILMSGSVTDHKDLMIENSGKMLAKAASCPDNNPKDMVECLRNVPYEKIIDVGEELSKNNKRLIWSYVIEPVHNEERFIIEHPTISMLRGDFAKVPIIAGISRNEFTQMAYGIYTNSAFLHMFNEHFELLAPNLFHYESETERSRYISNTLKKHYFKNEQLSAENLVALEHLFADSIITHGVHRFISLARQHTNVFNYRVNYVSRYSHFYNPDGSAHGVEHGDELQYIFVFKPIAPLLSHTDPENHMIEKMTSWWVQFAITGDPNNKEDIWINDINWEPCKNKIITLNIDTKCELSDEPYQDRYAIWDELFPIVNTEAVPAENCLKDDGFIEENSCGYH